MLDRGLFQKELIVLRFNMGLDPIVRDKFINEFLEIVLRSLNKTFLRFRTINQEAASIQIFSLFSKKSSHVFGKVVKDPIIRKLVPFSL